VNAKPTTEDLGINPDALDWQHSGEGSGSIEIAFVRGTGGDDVRRVPEAPADWVLMRMADDPDRRVLVFDRNEWECFLDGARKGEFDDAAGDPAPLGLAAVLLAGCV
jgi:hypothetical protein